MVPWPANNVEKRGSACSPGSNPSSSGGSSSATATTSSRSKLTRQPSPGSTPLSTPPNSTHVSQVTVNPTSHTSTDVVTPSPTAWVENIPSVFIDSILPEVNSELANGDPIYGSESGIQGMLTLADGALGFPPLLRYR